MNEDIFFIVHDEESYQKHPDLIGFHVKTDLAGNPIRDEKNNFVPEHSMVNEIKQRSKIVYYTRGDHLIRGIFEVGERLGENDNRVARDWTRSPLQFTIRPILKPKRDVDFRNIIFSGKETLDMFSHLDNLKKQWGMSIGGKNYIKKISQHDFELIEKALEFKHEVEAKDIFETPKFPRKHLAYQFRLVKILKSYGLKVHVARNDKAKIIDKGEAILESIPEFHNERLCDIASRIDLIGFSEYNVPKVLIEVVDTLGTLTESLFRLNEIALSYLRSEERRFYIIGPETARIHFDAKLESLTFKSLRNANCTFQSYEEIEKIFQESQKKKRKL